MEVFDETDIDIKYDRRLGCVVFSILAFFTIFGLCFTIAGCFTTDKSISSILEYYPTYPPRHANAVIPQKPTSKLAKEIYARLRDENRWKRGKSASGLDEMHQGWYAESFTDGEFEVHMCVERWSTGYSIWLNNKPMLYDYIGVCELEYLEYVAEELYKKLELKENKAKQEEEDRKRKEKEQEILDNLKEHLYPE